ncbi:hypothetical protein JCM19238_2184 [Vibrio ponticus]|nr:hypothetical protein JCM19238_2184 [Vibrio ponticus]
MTKTLSTVVYLTKAVFIHAFLRDLPLCAHKKADNVPAFS